MRTSNTRLENDSVEVVLTITAEATAEGRGVFLVEVHQAGLFTVRGFNEQEVGAILGSYCPGILFPYARTVVSDLVMKGSMPMLLLQPVNFDAVYAQSLGAPAGAGGTPPG
jgi:preprotein translocase subunit SecB